MKQDTMNGFKRNQSFVLSNAINWICDNTHKKRSKFSWSTFLQMLVSMLTGKLGNKLLNETTTNFKWLHVLFINKDLRKDVEYNNVGFAQIMQIWKRNNPLNSDISVTALFCSSFCASLGFRNANRSASGFVGHIWAMVVRMDCRHASFRICWTGWRIFVAGQLSMAVSVWCKSSKTCPGN